MRIAFLTPQYVTEKTFDGGLSNYLHRVSQALLVAGHEPEVFVLSDRTESLEHQGVPVHRVQPRGAWSDAWYVRLRRRLGLARFLQSRRTVRGAKALARGLMHRHRRRPFDVVQASDYLASALHVPVDAGFALVVRLSYLASMWREAEGAEVTEDRVRAERLEEEALARAPRRYAPSEFLAREVEQRLGVAVDVLHPPVFLARPAAGEDDSLFASRLAGREYILFFGRVCRVKGIDLLLRSLREVFDALPDATLVVVGRENHPGLLDDIVQREGLPKERILHLDAQAHERLFPLIRGASVVVLPSRVENFPNACVEALGLGRIVVATAGVGFDELIEHEHNGFLAPREDPRGLARCLLRAWALDPARRDAFAEASRLRLETYQPGRTIPALLAYFEGLAQAARSEG